MYLKLYFMKCSERNISQCILALILQSNQGKPYKTTTCLRRPILSPSKPIPIQSLLYKTTTCLTQPATTFVSQMKKRTCLKQPLQNFILQRKWKQCIKNNCLSNYNYSTVTLKCKLCLMFVKTEPLHLTYFFPYCSG